MLLLCMHACIHTPGGVVVLWCWLLPFPLLLTSKELGEGKRIYDLAVTAVTGTSTAMMCGTHHWYRCVSQQP